MKFIRGDTVKFILTGEKVMVVEIITSTTPGYSTDGYIIRNQYYQEVHVRDFEVEEWVEPEIESIEESSDGDPHTGV